MYSGRLVTRPDVNAFIPNVWQGDIRHFRSSKFVMQQAITVRSFVGKKGDTLYEPLVGRAAIYPKLAGQPVQLQSREAGEWELKINQHNESSYAIEDIVKIQSQYDLRTPYTKEAGYAMARDLDNAVLALRAAIPTTQQIFRTINAGAGTVAGDPAPIDSDVILAAKAYMLEQDVDSEDIMLLVNPTQYTDMLDIDKFISADYVNNQPVVNGVIGTVYGIKVMHTSNLKPNTLDGYHNGEGAPGQPTPGVIGSPYMPTQDAVVGTGLPRGKTGNEVAQPFVSCLMCSKEWAMLAVQKNISTEYSRENLLQADALVTTHAFGTRIRRANEAILIHSAA
jgi:hypothetical protein